MCLYSLETGEKTTKAKAGETLTRGEYRQHVCLLGKDKTLRCVSHGSELEIENFQLDRRNHALWSSIRINKAVGQPSGAPVSYNRLRAWQGKTFKVTLVHWQDGYEDFAADALKLPNGILVHLGWVAPGTQMTKRRKIRKDAGIRKPRNLEKVLGLDQIKADIPVNETVKG
jgi:hypothetical protein